MRIRPNDREKEMDRTVKKISSDELTFQDRKFSFDSVFDSDSKQVLRLILSLYILSQKLLISDLRKEICLK